MSRICSIAGDPPQSRGAVDRRLKRGELGEGVVLPGHAGRLEDMAAQVLADGYVRVRCRVRAAGLRTGGLGQLDHVPFAVQVDGELPAGAAVVFVSGVQFEKSRRPCVSAIIVHLAPRPLCSVSHHGNGGREITLSCLQKSGGRSLPE